MPPDANTTQVRFLLRLPVALHQRLLLRATRDRRSMNSMIVWLLERLTGIDADDGDGSPARVEESDHQ